MKTFLLAMTLLAACVVLPALLLLTLFYMPRRRRRALAEAVYPHSNPGAVRSPSPAGAGWDGLRRSA